jgi:aminoglycoside phosphotransferase (APT) family kinase protein
MMNHSGQSFSALLEAYCAVAFPDKENPQVKGLTDISAGWESVLYSFRLEHGPSANRLSERLVLRLLMGEGAADKATREFQAMRRLHEVGYSVPNVYAFGSESSPLGQPFILMEHIDGEQLWSLIANLPEDQWLTLFCRLFVQLHALDWRPFSDEQTVADPYHFIDQWLERGRHYLQQFPQIQEMQRVLEWLEARRGQMACLRPSPVHMDFHPANILVRPDGSAVVVDWTGFAVSDYRFDVAWTLVLAGAYEGAAMRNQILDRYEQLAGAKVEQLALFEVVACLRRLLGVSVSLLLDPEQMGMRPEATAMMRQQLPAHKRVAELLIEHTGIQLPQLETVWAS